MNLLPRIAALLGPLLIAGVCLSPMAAPKEWEPSKEVKEVEELLARTPPEILSIGNSKAASDIDPEILGAISDPPLKVARLKVDGSPAATWYTLLKYRVFANDYHPKLILVVAMMKPMLQTKIGSEHGAEAGLARMTQHFAEPDAIIAEKTLGQSGSGMTLRLTEARTALRTRILDGIRDQAGLLFFGESPLEALGKVFAQEAVDNHAGAARVIPVVESQSEKKSEKLDPNTSYIPDIVALAREHQARVVFVRSPLAPSFVALDSIDPSVEQATIELVNQLGAGWLDMRDMNFPESAFKDGYHLNPDASDKFSAELVVRLTKIGALGDAPIAAARIPTAPSQVERLGTSPVITPKGPGTRHAPCGEELKIPDLRFLSEDSLMQAGLGPMSPVVVLKDGKPLPRRTKMTQLADCGGAYAHVKDVVRYARGTEDETADFTVGFSGEPYMEVEGFPRTWWVYPGTKLVMHFDRSWGPENGDFAAEVGLRLFGKGSMVSVRVAGQAVPLSVGEEGELLGSVSGTGPQAGWTVEVESASNGPFVALSRLAFGVEGKRDVLVGGEPPLTIRLLEYAPLELPEVPTLGAAGEVSQKGGIYRLSVPWAAPFASDRLSKELKMRGCSPLRLFEDGVALPSPGSGFKAVKEEGGGKYLHQGGELLFSAVDNSDPRSNGREYTVGLDPKRDCRRQRWLYPGDVLVFQPPGSQTIRLRKPVQSLVLQATTTGDVGDKTPLTVILRDKNRVYLETTVPLSRLVGGTIGWDLVEAIPLKAPDIQVELRLPEGAPLVLVTMLTISEASAGEVGG